MAMTLLAGVVFFGADDESLCGFRRWKRNRVRPVRRKCALGSTVHTLACYRLKR